VTLVEVGIAMFIAGAMSGLMIWWIYSVHNADDLHRADDATIQDLRVAKEKIARELRRASAVVSIGADHVTIWVDDDRDDDQDTGELVTWQIQTDGDLVRATDAGDLVVEMGGLLVADSSFDYGTGTVAELTDVGFTFTAGVDAPRGDDGIRSIGTEIHLRGVTTSSTSTTVPEE
jgi:hypothetical protein